MRYPTKVDTWLVAVLTGSVALPVTVGVLSYVRVGDSSVAWLPIAITIFVSIGIGILAVPTSYEVTPDRLVIRSGVLRWEVPLSEILSITPTSNPMSSPAWSLDRLAVRSMREGRKRSILISPRRAQEFLREVASRDEGLIVDGDGVRRRSL